MTATQAIDLKRAVVIDPAHMLSWSTDIEAHADEYTAWMQAEGYAPLNKLAAMSGLLGLTQGAWRMLGRPEDEIMEKSHRWWVRCMERLTEEMLAIARPSGQG
jgi:hypothetical protein